MGLFSRLKGKAEGRRPSKAPKANVIIPLYQYPTNSATWTPLYNAIDANPDLNFFIIINPNSGPGSPPWWPDVNYLREVPKLNTKPNVRTLGYVRVDYCNRDVSDVVSDIKKYAKWPHDGGVKFLHVEGIFFDETPHEHSTFKATYLEKITQQVKKAEGILGEQLVFFNPGTSPDVQLTKRGQDVDVVFEESYSRFNGLSPKEQYAQTNYDRTKTCYMIHSTPEGGLLNVVREARFRADYVFATDLSEHFYEHFGKQQSSFSDFIAAMAAT
ncbi:hypothetical protein AC579_1139 [Pseudocercospora musae]|uniref:Spherulin-4 n=1 Tax=Pseudocercospora musae TaxID=113226 RepID=A0A139HH14_9PEZI|nr:hypothetical protein AC579_1139 [Pseudocercospora musae]